MLPCTRISATLRELLLLRKVHLARLGSFCSGVHAGAFFSEAESFVGRRCLAEVLLNRIVLSQRRAAVVPRYLGALPHQRKPVDRCGLLAVDKAPALLRSLSVLRNRCGWCFIGHHQDAGLQE